MSCNGKYQIPGINSERDVKEEISAFLGGTCPTNETVLPLSFKDAKNVTAFDVDGNSYLDLAFGLNVSCGHGHPEIVKTATEAFSSLANAGSYTTEQRKILSTKLKEFTKNHFGKAMFFSSGTEAVEAGLWFIRAIKGDGEILSFSGSYHGKTQNAVSMATMKPWNHPRTPGMFRVPYANCYRCAYDKKKESCGLYCLKMLDGLIRQNCRGTVAGIVIEPTQGEAVVSPPEGYLKALRTFCDERNILLMVDEILTGIGRLGYSYACEAEGIIPDIITFGKCLSSGIPISAVMIREEYVSQVEQVIGSSTYGGNPLSTMIAAKTLDIIVQENLLDNVRKIGEVFKAKFVQTLECPYVGEIRGKGFLWGIEFVKDKESKAPFPRFCQEVAEEALFRGVIAYPIAQTLRMSPSLVMTEAQAEKAAQRIVDSITCVTGKYNG